MIGFPVAGWLAGWLAGAEHRRAVNYSFDLSRMFRVKITDGIRSDGIFWMSRQFLTIFFVWSAEYKSRNTATFRLKKTERQKKEWKRLQFSNQLNMKF